MEPTSILGFQKLINLNIELEKAKPNFELRIRRLKRDWPIVYDMLSGKDNSSFSWDEYRQLVVAKDVVWNSHKKAGQFRHRSFPYYDQLTTIYAKDRAIGKNAHTTADIVEEIYAKDVATENIPKERNYHGCEADVSLDEMDVSTTQSQPLRPNQHDSIFFVTTHFSVVSKIVVSKP
ncbi:hypothetical protein Godav_010390 [Gossypium davidsonii]|uniref:Myb/SANT-like domain-containing protein n=1 Tax=Gossypium davidsonii TaxID=34287 RepID=A0A7J8SG95_GOSDV|nr:hypothetical protein [Gossypium davidsonii]